MSSPIHQSISFTLNKMFIVSKAILPRNLQAQTRVAFEVDFNGSGVSGLILTKEQTFGIQVNN